ncbi:MAG: DEAD/DEAH box helicase [Desulfobacterales bacterium]|nr:DEAD/DEAH box helicase [Desulfobacterales bacterium]
MKELSGINEYVKSLMSSPRLGHQVVFHKIYPSKPPVWSKPDVPWPDPIAHIMRSCGIERLYQHQARAMDLIRSGCHVVTATPTASGKSLIYNLPVLERIYANRNAKALYIFPLKALTQDQLRTFNEMTSHCSGVPVTASIYDGDTSAWHRKRIRENPPGVLLTNPEMLHLSLLAYHPKWAAFFAALEIVVIDELHTYRGLMGSHMAQVFRRLQRICAFYGSAPRFVFSSATVANPAQLAEELTGVKVTAITASGAPQGRRHLIFIDPVDGPAQTAILLLKAALHRNLRTIVYTQSRKLAELIALWAGSRAGPYSSKISAYRSGFLAEERREIEARLARGDLLAVISTSALELGIDIGDLDLCLLVGYPGTVISTWQRGGRVGRSGQDSALVLIAGEDALDQYFMRNPQDFIRRSPEAAVINPFNEDILRKHLLCAAAELPLTAKEPAMANESVRRQVRCLEDQGLLLRSEDGKKLYASRIFPHRDIALRGVGSRFRIVCSRTGENKGEIDGFRAFRETHAGAVYLHLGSTYIVDALDLETRTVRVTQENAAYYTRATGYKNTEILEVFKEKKLRGATICVGRLKVTDQVTGYEKWRIRANKLINRYSLDLPPQIFETEGIWLKIPGRIQEETEKHHLHFMGGIHAIEHAAIGITPLIVMTDRNDLGGLSTPLHPQTGSAAIFIYDGIPGGAGLSRHAYDSAKKLFQYTQKAIQTCPCETGCPSCVHSPKCGSGNRPIDKDAAVFILNRIQAGSGSEIRSKKFSAPGPPVALQRSAAPSVSRVKEPLQRNSEAPSPQPAAGVLKNSCFGVFDLETQRSSQEVGGWHRADLMGISCGVLYDSREDAFFEFTERQIDKLVLHLQQFDLVVGFNVRRFDYHVLQGYTDFDFSRLPTLDMLSEVHKHLGYRLSLDHLARETLGRKKSADGLQALKWWKEGRIKEIAAYCRQDVEITKDLFLFGRKTGYLLFSNKAGKVVRVPVKW